MARFLVGERGRNTKKPKLKNSKGKKKKHCYKETKLMGNTLTF